MDAETLSANTSIEIKGYVTDPKRVGYQIVTNYESLYWRCLVGFEAWSLYELLRTFCHEGKDTCHPSINYLMALMGVKERRIFTGWAKTVKGKEYKYPGLIEILQEHSLVVAEVIGEGVQSRYVFHVNLTPGLLSDKMIEDLPLSVQKKHAELIERCERAIRQLKSKRRPPKVDMDDTTTDADSEMPEGSGNLPEGGLVNYQRGSGNLPNKQQPINNTHTTTAIPRDMSLKDNNNSEKVMQEIDEAVVVALKEQGIGPKVVQRLAQDHPSDLIHQKLDYLTFLQEKEPKKISNPRGWLRKAIEEDYGPPDGYKSLAERQAESEARQARQLAIEEAIAEQEHTSQPPEDWRQWLAEQEGTPDDLQRLSDQLRSDLKGQVTQSTFHAWVSNHLIVSLDGERAEIAVPSKQAQDWLLHRYRRTFEETLSALVEKPVSVDFHVVERSREGEDDD